MRKILKCMILSLIMIGNTYGFATCTRTPTLISLRGGMRMSDNKSGLGWDSHKAIDQIPESLCKTIDGNDSMRRKFEALCRNAQVFY